MHRYSPVPHVDVRVDHNQWLPLGTSGFNVLHTPGHTPDSMSLFMKALPPKRGISLHLLNSLALW
jgi:glyoxylase-like metal-dependent hydrolase (beta-lactamase superfamily II)